MPKPRKAERGLIDAKPRGTTLSAVGIFGPALFTKSVQRLRQPDQEVFRGIRLAFYNFFLTHNVTYGLANFF